MLDYTSEEMTRSKTEKDFEMVMKRDYTSEELTRSKTEYLLATSAISSDYTSEELTRYEGFKKFNNFSF